MVLPFIWMMSTSFKLPEDIFGLPSGDYSPKPGNPVKLYLHFSGEKPYKSSGKHLLCLSHWHPVEPFLTSLGGYGFVKFELPGKKAAFAFLLATMIIPGAVMMVQLVGTTRKICWVVTF